MDDIGDEQPQQQQPSREQDGGGAGSLGPNNDNRRSARARAPSPVWVREEDGSMEWVERTPFNVMLWDLDDPFAEEQGDDDDDDDFESDGHDSVESDDENNLVKLDEPLDSGIAAIYLEDLMDKYRRYRLRDLTVSFANEVIDDRSALPDDVRKLVSELGEYDRIRELHLTRGNFGREDPEWRGAGEGAPEVGENNDTEVLGADLSILAGEACLEELFGTVLCRHISLDDVTISKSRIPTRYWKLFTEGLLTSDEAGGAYVHLTLQSTPLTMEGCQLLKRMCQRKARVSWLSLEDCGLGDEEWRAVCEGVAESGGEMDGVTLSEKDVTVGPDTLLPLLRPPAAVDVLSVCPAHWAEGAFEGLVRGLRTNETMLDVSLNNVRDFPCLRLVEELLTTYNCTLEDFNTFPRGDGASQTRINALLQRNTRIRALLKPDSATPLERYHVSRTTMWPRVLAEYSRLPTQLYRFVRHGNLEDFASQAEDVAATAAAAAATAAPAVDRPRVKKKRRKVNSK